MALALVLPGAALDTMREHTLNTDNGNLLKAHLVNAAEDEGVYICIYIYIYIHLHV